MLSQKHLEKRHSKEDKEDKENHKVSLELREEGDIGDNDNNLMSANQMLDVEGKTEQRHRRAEKLKQKP